MIKRRNVQQLLDAKAVEGDTTVVGLLAGLSWSKSVTT